MGFDLIKVSQLLAEKKIYTVSPSVKLQTDDINGDGKTAVVSQDQDFIVGYTDLVDPKLNDIPFVVFGDHTEIFKYIDFPFMQGADGIKIIKTNSKFIDSKFLYYALKSCYYPTGFYQRHFKLLKKTFIPNLPIFHQKKIATVLNNYDLLIKKNNERAKVLEKIAEELFKEWFVRYRFPGYEKNSFAEGVPSGWKKCRLRDISKEVGKPIKKEQREQYDYYLPIDCLPNRKMVLSEEDIIENAESSLESFKKGDILFGAMRTYFHKVIIAPFDGLTRGTCFVLGAKNKDYQNFLYLLLYQDSTIDFSSTVSVGSTMPYVRWKDLNRINVVLPDEKIIIAFNRIVDPILRRIREMYFINKMLSRQRDALLPRLMSGKLSVEGKEIV